MISSLISGRLVKPPQIDDSGRYVGTVICFEGDRSVRIVCKSRHAKTLMDLPVGSPVSISGLLRITPVISGKGKAHAFLQLEVTAILTVTEPKGLLARILKRGQA